MTIHQRLWGFQPPFSSPQPWVPGSWREYAFPQCETPGFHRKAAWQPRSHPPPKKKRGQASDPQNEMMQNSKRILLWINNHTKKPGPRLVIGRCSIYVNRSSPWWKTWPISNLTKALCNLPDPSHLGSSQRLMKACSADQLPRIGCCTKWNDRNIFTYINDQFLNISKWSIHINYSSFALLYIIFRYWYPILTHARSEKQLSYCIFFGKWKMVSIFRQSFVSIVLWRPPNCKNTKVTTGCLSELASSEWDLIAMVHKYPKYPKMWWLSPLILA